MQVRAKFNCESIKDTQFAGGGSQRTVTFRAVYGREGENGAFTKYTPSGTVEIQLDSSGAAYDHFKPGKAYYLDFTEAE